MTRREAVKTIGIAAAGAAVIGLGAATGLGSLPGALATGSRSVQSELTMLETGYAPLFDGTSLDGWEQSGPGGFTFADGMLQSFGGMGLLWYGKRQFSDFILKVVWKEAHWTDNSGVFVRFPDPGDNPWVAVDNGYEIQIDNFGAPNGDPIYQTGAIFNFVAPSHVASNPVGEWNYYEIQAVGQNYTVVLNGQQVTDYVGSRGTSGYVGLQNHDDTSTVTFRSVTIKEL